MRETTKLYIDQLHSLLDFEDMGWWIVDFIESPDSFYCNDRLADMFELDKSVSQHSITEGCPIAGDYNQKVMSADRKIADQIFDDYARLLSCEISVYNNKFPLHLKDGRQSYFKSRAKALEFDGEGQIAILYGIITDVTEEEEQRHALEVQKKQFKELSEKDVLTQLYNRGKFLELYSYELKRSVRKNEPIGLLMIDIDNFKAFNDKLGHLAGDLCLKAVADTLAEALKRESDIVARYGGEEFIVFIPDSSVEKVETAGKKIIELLASRQIEHPASEISKYVTLSIGGSVGITDTALHEEPIRLADEMLYLVKRSGKNNIRVTTY